MKIKKNQKLLTEITQQQITNKMMMKLFWKKIIEYQIFDSRKATFDETSSDYDKLLNDDMCTSLMDE